MTDGQRPDPHAEFRRQAAQHFKSAEPQVPRQRSDPPKIFRGNAQPPAAESTTPIPLDNSRFTAGTTYTGRSAPPGPAAPPQGDSRPPHPRLPFDEPSQPPPPPPPRPPDAVPGPPPLPSPTPATSGVGFQPFHALWGLTALLLIASLFLGIGWVLVAAGCGAAAYHTQARQLVWPSDIAALSGNTDRPAGSIERQSEPPVAVIALRPLTFPEIFVGAFRIMARNWPTLIGIPTVILVAFATVYGIAVSIVLWLAMSLTSATLSGGTDPSSDLMGLFAGFVGLFLVIWVVAYIVALPADALLLGLTVIATDKAVRGRHVRMSEVLSAARGRMFAVCRLTVFYYGLFFVVEAIAVVVVMAMFSVAPPVALLFSIAAFAGSFVLGILFSLAPIVLVVENRGVVDSLKRAAQLAKPAAGRLFGIHSLWTACVIPLILIPGILTNFILGDVGAIVFFVLAIAGLIAYFRILQMLIYTDLRMRQEHFETELIADWSRNTG